MHPDHRGRHIRWFFNAVAMTSHLFQPAIPLKQPSDYMKNLTSGGSQRTLPPQGYYSQTASSSLWGPKFLCGQMLLSKTGCAFWQCTHRVEIPICKSHVNLLNFSWKGGSVYDEIYLGSQAVQCARYAKSFTYPQISR